MLRPLAKNYFFLGVTELQLQLEKFLLLRGEEEDLAATTLHYRVFFFLLDRWVWGPIHCLAHKKILIHSRDETTDK